MYQNDDAFAQAFENCTLPNDQFHHRDHLRLAFIYLRRYGLDQAGIRISESICRFATHHRGAEKYHQTITIAWMRLLAAAAQDMPSSATLDQIFEAVPALLNKNTICEYYSPALLTSPEARRHFAEPDVKPLPL